MLDFKNGIEIIKGCNLRISFDTTMEDVFQAAKEYIIQTDVVNSGYTHVTLLCDMGLNYEEKNPVTFISYAKEKIVEIMVWPNQIDVRYPEGRIELAKACRAWLRSNGQNVDRQVYEWGRVGFVDGEELNFGAGIRFHFLCNRTN